MYHGFHKTMKQHNIDDNIKNGFLGSKKACQNLNDFWKIMWHWRLE